MGLVFLSVCMFASSLSSSVYVKESKNASSTRLSSPYFSRISEPTKNLRKVVSRKEYEKNEKFLGSPYLHLPVFKHSRFPLLNKDQFSPVGGPGHEQLPENVREVLIPARSRPTTSSQVNRRPGIRVVCDSKEMRVKVFRFTLGCGLSQCEVKLGTCNISRVTKRQLFFISDMRRCGTKREIINNRLVYSNTLHYTVVETTGSVRSVYVPIQCHFNRFHYSYKMGFLPHVETRRLFKPLKTQGRITLTPCDAQWNRLSPSEGYTMGFPMYFEAKVSSVAEGERLFVHSCHVNTNSSHVSVPQIIIIDNYGCISDSKNNNQSRFIESSRRNVVRFSVVAFVFPGSPVKHQYMHCEMCVKNEIPTATSKFCTYNQNKNRWEELSGSNTLCSCCSSTCLSGAPTAISKTITSESWSMTGQEHGSGDGEITWGSWPIAGPGRQMIELPRPGTFEEVFGLN